MRGTIWTVVVVGTLLAISPAVVTTDGTNFANNLEPLFSSLSVVAGVLLFIVAMGAFLRMTGFAGGGGGF